ncbi:MAG: hypothetical protein U0441_18895 [Polyangiaceae bacterium]
MDIVGPSNQDAAQQLPAHGFAAALQAARRRPRRAKTARSLSRSPPRGPISKPLLIGQGANDPRVKQVEADQIVKAMQDKKIPVTYVLDPDEDIGFNCPQTALRSTPAETFLAQCLKGHQPVGDDFQDRASRCRPGPIRCTACRTR